MSSNPTKEKLKSETEMNKYRRVWWLSKEARRGSIVLRICCKLILVKLV